MPPLPLPPAGLVSGAAAPSAAEPAAALPPPPAAPVAAPHPVAHDPAPIPRAAPWHAAARASSSPSLEIAPGPPAAAVAGRAGTAPFTSLSDAELEAELSLLMGDEPAAARPPAAPTATEGPLGDLVDELDARFDAARLSSRPSAPPPPSGPDVVTTTSDLEGVRQLFSEMASSYTRPVRDFMEELSHTDASRSWLDACEPALEALRSTSDQLGMLELRDALDACLALFVTARTAAHERLTGELRAELLARFSRLTDLLPSAFEVGGSREPIIVQLLLLQVPGVHKRTVEKLARAGVCRLDALLGGTPEELAAVAGVELELATRITDRFRGYASRVRSMLAELEPKEEYATLARLLARLREEDDAFERARAGWSKEHVEDKRRLRGQRSVTLKEIYVVLVRLGEVERVDALQRLPVRRQLEELEQLASDGSRRRSRMPFA